MFFQLRSQRQTGEQKNLNFDNVAFVLNAVDALAGDERFVEIRKRRPTYRTLKTLDQVNQNARDRVTQSENAKKKEFEAEIEKEERRLNDELDALRKDNKLKLIDKESRLQIFERDIQRRLAAKRQQIEVRLEKETKELKREQTESIRSKQHLYKMCAVILPPILPLLIGLVVYFNRRAREQEGVERSRLR
jgi:ABC-2 type transport system permease protein